MSRGVWTPNRWVVVLAAAVLIGAVLAWAGQAGHGRSLAGQGAEIAELQGRLGQRRQAKAKAVDENASKALGVTATRLQDDEAIITSLLSTAFTWDSGQAYENARASLSRRYGLDDDDQFLRTFMPPALYIQDGKGAKHYLFDERGMRATFGGAPEIVVVRVAGTRYRYAVMADIAFGSKERASGGQAADSPVTRRMLLWITIDGQGAVSDLSGIPATGTTRTSR